MHTCSFTNHLARHTLGPTIRAQYGAGTDGAITSKMSRLSKGQCIASGSGLGFLCQDVSYIDALLRQGGYGDHDGVEPELTNYITNTQIGWALGAALHLLFRSMDEGN